MGLFNNIVQGAMGNLSEMSIEEATNEYGSYLMSDENIEFGLKLVRDVIIFTNERIITIDKQGATGSKMKITSINLMTLIDVEAETAGMGLDDSEISIKYITSPNLKSISAVVQMKKFEFPKKYNIIPLYKMLQEIAHKNFVRINS